MNRRRKWTPEDDAELRRRHALGETFSEIGSALGRSDNSCIGRAWRLGMEQRSRPEQLRRGMMRWHRRMVEADRVAGT